MRTFTPTEETIETIGQVIIARLCGAFSLQQAKEFYQHLATEVDKINRNPFAIIMNLAEFGGTTPEGFAVSEEFNQRLVSMPLVCKVNVINNQAMAGIVNQQIPSRQKHNLQVFANEQDALEYVSKQLSL